jgi:hypothetical protein
MFDRRNIKLEVGDSIIVIESMNYRFREGVIDHFKDEEGIEVAYFMNGETGRMNKAHRQHTFKVPAR